MKRTLSFLSLALFFFLVACDYTTIPYYSREESQQNFVNYQTILTNYLTDYDLVLGDPEIESKIQPAIYRWTYTISIAEDSELSIELFNQYETEVFMIILTNQYTDENSATTDLDPAFITGLVNCLSGMEWDEELVTDFISAPEDDYPIKKYDIEKQDNELVHKYFSLSKKLYWTVSYILYDDFSETLTFLGVTK